ncbi:hypothetical protein [Paenibacillus ferrarius]|uniref:hypothetical protein n=1 Tax=Paenibacillus ferrarius TaxID=1469647 RepID=UPI003D293613
MQDAAHYILPLLFIAFFIYRRIKRTVGFQPLRRRRLIVRTSLFSVFGVVILALGFVHPIHFIGYGLGLAGGTLLGLTAIRHTRFEHRADGWYYRTHLWIDITVLVLFLGRLAYRYAAIAVSSTPSNMNPADFSQFSKDPVTAGAFFIIVSYYVIFFGYLLREEKKLDPPALHATTPTSPAGNTTIAE